MFAGIPAAARAVHHADLHAEVHPGQFLTFGDVALARQSERAPSALALRNVGHLHVDGLHRGGGVLELLVGHHAGTDGGVGADQRALVALDAVLGHPLGDDGGHATLLVGRGAGGEGAVLVAEECRHGQVVAALWINETSIFEEALQCSF